MGEIRTWLGQIVCCLCLMTWMLQIIPENGLKRYVRFFLGILFLLVVLEPMEGLLGGEEFWNYLESESQKGLLQIYESGQAGLSELSENWEDGEWQRNLEQKIEEIYEIYQKKEQQDDQKAGVEHGENGMGR